MSVFGASFISKGFGESKLQKRIVDCLHLKFAKVSECLGHAVYIVPPGSLALTRFLNLVVYLSRGTMGN